MPIHLPPLSRRRFLASSAAAAAGLLLPGRSWGADALAPAGGTPVDPDRLALLSDIHVAADPAAVNRGVNMADHLAAAVRAVLDGPARPAGLLVNGDLAYNAGLPGDYATVLAGLAPVRAAGVPVHLTLGNHDDRANFFRAL
ncbi:MAG: cpdA 2, partial [Phycisphaerales bacterium]|nr:cpdA 2 [Phycisphaerales bacterium]